MKIGLRAIGTDAWLTPVKREDTTTTYRLWYAKPYFFDSLDALLNAVGERAKDGVHFGPIETAAATYVGQRMPTELVMEEETTRTVVDVVYRVLG